MIAAQVIKTIEKYNMLAGGDHVVAGVSGGADSVCLLHLLQALKDRWHLRLTVAHLDHMLRGEQSRQEAAFVRGIAEGLGIPCVVEQRDVHAYKEQKGLSLQEAAREVRYGFFMDVLRKYGAHKIALGHHADDQAETILMRLLRGASLQGLTGIPPVRDGIIIRPMLEVTRGAIEEYLQKRNISYVRDTSAAEQHYLRNKIRHSLLPLLQKEYNPQIVGALTGMADTLRQDSDMLEDIVAQAVSGCLVQGSGELCCSLDLLKEYSPSLRGRIFRKLICRLKGDTRELSFKHIDALCRLADGQGPSRLVQLPGGWCVRREYDSLIFESRSCNKNTYCYSFDTIPESLHLEQLGRTIFFSIEDSPPDIHTLSTCGSDVALLDYGAAVMPLVVRNWLPGDRFFPLGLGGSKKLQDFFVDNKIPRRKRAGVPVLLFRDKIAWVCGCRIDERFKVRPETGKIIRVRLA